MWSAKSKIFAAWPFTGVFGLPDWRAAEVTPTLRCWWGSGPPWSTARRKSVAPPEQTSLPAPHGSHVWQRPPPPCLWPVSSKPPQGKGRGPTVSRGGEGGKGLEGEQLGSNVLTPTLSGPGPSTAVPVGGLMLPLGTLSGTTWLSEAQRHSSAVLLGPNLPESSPVPSSTHRPCQSDLLSCKSLPKKENLLTSQFLR